MYFSPNNCIIVDNFLQKNTFYFDFRDFIYKHKENRTVQNVQFLLDHVHLIIKFSNDVIPSFSSNIWFKTKYNKELKALNLTSKYSTTKNVVYHDLLQNYIKLSSRIEDQIDHFSSQYFVSDCIIGLQIRTGKMPDRTENKAIFYNSDHSDSINEALRIYNELLSLNITSKMYMID